MELTPAEIDILFDAVEGYAPLWDAKWECSRQKPSQPDNEWIRQGTAALQKLSEHDLILLHWDDQENAPDDIALEHALELLQQDKYWSLSEDGKPLYFSSTGKGEEAFCTNEQIKAYYGSKEFALRYPAPEWHPMKRTTE